MDAIKTRGQIAYDKWRLSPLAANHAAYGIPAPWHERAPSIRAEWEMIATSEEHLVVITIGDFSGDGHSQAISNYFRCNKSRDDVREAWFAAKGIVPENLWPSALCREYDERVIWAKGLNQLRDLGAPLPENPVDVDGEYMLALTLWFLRQGDPTLEFEPIEAPSLMFCGPDAKGRYSESIGYGCFS